MKTKRSLLIALTVVLTVALALVLFVACGPLAPSGGDPSGKPSEGGSGGSGDVHIVTFVADGRTIDTEAFTEGMTSVPEPDVPFKDHYTGHWEDYTLGTHDITVHAVYVPIDYKLKFVEGDFSVEVTYNADNIDDFVAPEVPAKPHYTGEWEEFTFDFYNGQEVHAVYTPITYKITFEVEDYSRVVRYSELTPERMHAPDDVPEKTGYVFEWEDFEFEYDDDQVVHGAYVPKTYTLNLNYNGETGDVTTLTVRFDEAVEGLPQLDGTGMDFCGWYYNGNELVNGETPWTWDVENPTAIASKGDTQGVVYILGDGYYGAIDYEPREGENDIRVLEMYKGLPVTAVDIAFRSAHNLTSVVIPQSVEIINDRAFANCENLQTVTIEGNRLKSIRMLAFSSCVKLTEIDLPSSVTEIKDSAFLGCTSLQTVTFGPRSKLQTLGAAAFEGCTKLQDITLPIGLTKIEGAAFRDCAALTIYCEAAEKPKDWNDSWNSLGSYYDPDSCPVVWNCLENDVADDGNIYAWDGGLKYAVRDNLATVVRAAYEGEIVIPDNMKYKEEPYSVVAIGKHAFSMCTELETVKISANILTIDGSVFYGDASLTIYCVVAAKPASWSETWNEYDYNRRCPVVWNCNVNNVAEDGYVYAVIDGLRYALKDGEAKVVSYNYKGNVVIPAEVEYNGVYAVTEIGNYAFQGCVISDITLPSSVVKVGSDAFANSDITNVYYDGTIADWCNVEFAGRNSNPTLGADNFYFKNDGEWAELTENLVIPDGVTSVKAYTFYGNELITSVTIPESVTSVADSAFDHCSSLLTVYWNAVNCETGSVPGYNYITTLVIGENVESLANELFGGCTHLSSVTFAGDKLVSIGDEAFSSCINLTEITIPSSVTTMGRDVFLACSSLMIYCEAKEKPEGWNYRWNGWNGDDCPVVWNCRENNVAADGCIYVVEQNVRYALKNGEATVMGYGYSGEVVLLYSVRHDNVDYLVTAIAERAFYKSGVTWVNIPSGVKTIGDDAFYQCYDLQTVEIEADSKLQTIGREAFEYCLKLTEITIPKDVTYISERAFNECQKLTTVYWNAVKLSFDGFGNIGFADNTNLTTLIVGADVELLPDAFSDCTKLTSVTFLGNKLQTISKDAFSNTALTEITIPSSVTDIEMHAFENCTQLKTVTFAEGCQLQNVGYKAFYYCEILSDINLPDTVKNIDGSAFEGCFELTELKLPEQLETVGVYTFSGCGFTEITIPSSVISLDNYAFGGCGNVTSLKFAEGSKLQSIGSGAFVGCNLKEVIIPASVTHIGAYAFGGSSEMQSATFENPDGWTANDEPLTLTDPAANAVLLTQTYLTVDWDRH